MTQPNQDLLTQYEVKPLATPDDLSKYEVKIPEESMAQYIGRGAARVGSRLGETILGLPGDIRGLAKGAYSKIQEKAFPSLAKLEEIPPSMAETVFPSSEKIRETAAEVTGGYTEPQTKGEARADEFLTDFALLATPVKGNVPFARAFGMDVAGHLAKEGAEKLGFSDTAQDLTKLGAFFLTGMITSGKTAKTFTEDLYKQRDSVLPANADIDASKLKKQLEGLKTHLEKGVPGTKENAVLNPINKLLEKSAGGRINVEELLAAKRQVNEKIGEVIAKEGIKPRDAKQAFKPLGRFIEEGIEMYGKQSNPEFLKLHKEANQAFGAIEQSKKTLRFLSDKVPSKDKLAAGVLFELYTLGPLATAQTAIYGGAAFGAAKGGELLYRTMKSPVLRKYYAGVVKNALQENALAAAKNLKALDHKMKTEDPELYEMLKQYQVKDENQKISSVGSSKNFTKR